MDTGGMGGNIHRNQVTSHTVPIDSKNSFPTEPEAEAESKKQGMAWIDWIYPSVTN